MEEDQQKKALEFQILNSQFEQYKQQLVNLKEQQKDISNLSISLKEISKLKTGDEFLSPLSSGVLVKANLKTTEDVLMAVGAGVMVKKPNSWN